MKKTRILAGALSCMMIFSSGVAFAQEVASPKEASTMNMPQTRMISGTFNDYFPDGELAVTVAKALNKFPTDTITLWELQDIRVLNFDMHRHPTYGFTGNSIDFKNIGYLMNLERINFSDRGRGNNYGKIDLNFGDDILNCKKLTTIYSWDTPIVLPDILASSTLNKIELIQEVYSPMKNMAILSPAVLEKFNDGNLKIEYLYGASSQENLYTYEKGSDFDIRNLIAPTYLQTMPKTATSVNCTINQNNTISWNLTESFDQFLDKINQQILEIAKTSNNITVDISFEGETEYGGGKAHMVLPIEIVKGPVKKDVNLIGITFTGTPLQIKGQIKGSFEDGSHILDRATIDAQDLQIFADGAIFGPSTILNMQISVINDEIVGGTIVGQFNGKFYSVMF